MYYVTNKTKRLINKLFLWDFDVFNITMIMRDVFEVAIVVIHEKI